MKKKNINSCFFAILFIGELNGSCILEKGSDKGHIGIEYGFLWLTQVVTIKSFEDVDTG